ncbi:hypothetical protein PGQ11_006170 [Apiospora arundinis]|uniref:DUF7924 domain-containing protein n=1 Tax=Apiospora arundinis TaxID=335852 RepID=A0ABR2IRX8_9PEZI
MMSFTKKHHLDTSLTDERDDGSLAKRPHHYAESMHLSPEDPELGYIEPDQVEQGSPAQAAPESPTPTVSAMGSNLSGRRIEQGDYRDRLSMNNIIYLEDGEPAPGRIVQLCNQIARQEDCASPDPIPDEDCPEFRDLKSFQHNGAREIDLKFWVSRYLFPGTSYVSRNGLAVKYENSFKRACIPGPTDRINKVSTPCPSLTYGYAARRHDLLFSEVLDAPALKLKPWGGTIDDWLDLAFPFLTVEVVADGPEGGGFFIATSKCLSASASCVNVVSSLADRLREHPGSRVLHDATFSVAMNQSVAEIYVSWRTEDGLGYRMQDVACFFIKKPEEYLQFCRCVKNIMDWGKGSRLKLIQEALKFVEEDQE